MIIGNNIYTAIGLFATCGVMLLGLCSTFPATIAYTKGRSFVKWYILSLVIFPISLVASLIIKRKKDI